MSAPQNQSSVDVLAAEFRNLRASFDAMSDVFKGHSRDFGATQVDVATLKEKVKHLEESQQSMRNWFLGLVATFVTSGAAFFLSQYVSILKQLPK